MSNVIIFKDVELDLSKFPELIENDDHDNYSYYDRKSRRNKENY